MSTFRPITDTMWHSVASQTLLEADVGSTVQAGNSDIISILWRSPQCRTIIVRDRGLMTTFNFYISAARVRLPVPRNYGRPM